MVRDVRPSSWGYSVVAPGIQKRVCVSRLCSRLCDLLSMARIQGRNYGQLFQRDFLNLQQQLKRNLATFRHCFVSRLDKIPNVTHRVRHSTFVGNFCLFYSPACSLKPVNVPAEWTNERCRCKPSSQLCFASTKSLLPQCDAECHNDRRNSSDCGYDFPKSLAAELRIGRTGNSHGHHPNSRRNHARQHHAFGEPKKVRHTRSCFSLGWDPNMAPATSFASAQSDLYVHVDRSIDNFSNNYATRPNLLDGGVA
ncbi:hypothetical protein CNE_1c13490 [Cupriavidus necator N-1]|uniref:Uncharacterized protein n=1 Tax=Cupriavidus necator (strain ATCC 43291 / DSM 13513 / CCUG 52238 / LMG 8453 / N-1) TaxID=1042878 RepID=G0ES80_CUPNN|nr:hypothetical protein CNE_1c13490 [Cupriavidus necator N-1]